MPELSRLHTQNTSANLFDGRYRLGDGRWEGAVGVVREAYDTSRGDLRVVIKHPDPYQGPQVRAYKEQLLNLEAEALERLESLPHICRMLHRGRMGNGPGAYRYLVIEWADGDPVSAMLQNAAHEGRSLPIGTLLTMLVQLARVLAEAHLQGLINNDVDVKHLYWNQQARNLKVIDWGNAKLTSSPDWASYSFQDDVEQFADVMYCLLTGRQALDADRPDLAFWQEALADIFPAVRDDLARIGSQASPPNAAYPRAVELRDDLEACQARFREYLAGPLGQVDEMLEDASPEALKRAEGVLEEIVALAPVDEDLVRRQEALARIRRERREAAAMQLGSAYIKAESWLDAVEVLSRTFGHQAPPDSAPGLLLAAAKLLDAHRAGRDEATERAWAAAAKALVDRHPEEAVDAYLSVPAEALDTTVEPLGTLLALTDRYVLRHELRVIVRDLADLREAGKKDSGAGGNSHGSAPRTPATVLGRVHRDLRQALTGLNACPAHDWIQQHDWYTRIAAALDVARRLPGLPEGLEEHLEVCAARAADVVGHCASAEEALTSEAFDRAAGEMAAVARIDPDNTSPARQAERLRRLQPVFQRIHQFDGWNDGAWAQLEKQVLAKVESAFTSLPGSSLKTRVLELAGEVIVQQAIEREEEHLGEGLRLLAEGDWYAAQEWAMSVRRRHADWRPAAYVAGLAEAYVALFDPEDALLAHERAQDVLQDLGAPPPQHEVLREHKKRLEVMAECSQHLVSPDEEQQVLAQVVAQNLPEGDAYRAGLLRGIALTRELRMAVREGRWTEALAAATGLHDAHMPVMAALASAWQSLLEHLAEAERLRDEGHYPQALGCLENALRALPAVELGRPAPTIEAVRQGIGGAREMLSEEWEGQQQQAQAVEAEQPREAEARHPSPRSADGLVRRTGARVIRVADGLRRKRLPSGREALRGAGGWLRETGARLNAALEGRPAAARRRYPSAPPVKPRRRTPVSRSPEETEEAEPPRRAVAADDPALRHATRQVDGMRWAIGGAAIVGVLALALALALVRDSEAGNRLGLSGQTAARAAIGRIEGLLEEGNDTAAAEALGELWAHQTASMTEDDRLAAEALDDCVWLRTRGTEVTAEKLRADLERLPLLWERAQIPAGAADAGGFDCPFDGGMAAAVAAAAEARRAALEATLAEDTPAVHEALLGTLDGLDLAALGAPLGDASAFARLASRAQAGLARHWLAQGDCEQAAAAIAEARGLLAADAQSPEAAEIEALAAAQEACAGTRDLCGALGGLAGAPPDHPGDDLALLASAETDREALAAACPDLAYDDLVAGRLAALGALAQEGAWATAIEEGLQLAGHAWFGQPPVEGQASPAEVVATSYAALLAAECPEGACDAAAAAWLPAAEAFYGAHRHSLSPAGLVGLADALRGAGSECAECGLEAAGPISTTAVSLVDPALGEWSNHGMYFSHTGTGLAWHLNDVFIREQIEATAIYPEEGAEHAHGLYATAFEPLEGPPTEVVSVRVQGSMISAGNTQTAERPLWGIQVPGSDQAPLYVLLVWGPAAESEAGRRALHLWRPLDDDRQVVPLPDGRLDDPVELAIVRGLDGETFDVIWQGDLVIAGQPLPAPAGEARVVLVIGEGAHAWIREAEAEVVH